jgi:hypothetical protein
MSQNTFSIDFLYDIDFEKKHHIISDITQKIRLKIEDIINEWVELETRLTVQENIVINMIRNIEFYFDELRAHRKVLNSSIEYIKSIEYDWVIVIMYQLTSDPMRYIQIKTAIK